MVMWFYCTQFYVGTHLSQNVADHARSEATLFCPMSDNQKIVEYPFSMLKPLWFPLIQGVLEKAMV